MNQIISRRKKMNRIYEGLHGRVDRLVLAAPPLSLFRTDNIAFHQNQVMIRKSTERSIFIVQNGQHHLSPEPSDDPEKY